MDGYLYKTDSNGNPNVFNVEHNSDDRWLNANNGNADNFWNPENRWVFARSKSFYFSPRFYRGEFCFCIFPSQPPSILPISLIFCDN